ncbi:MAG: 3-hydroxyacyl-ACP dehydratase FabZ [bacterium]
MAREVLPDGISVLDFLKQRFPIQMVDRVLSWEKGRELKAVKNITMNDIHFMGHFPGIPVFPGVLTIECFAQAAAILVRLTEGGEVKGVFDAIGSVMDFRFIKPVVPGDRLETHVTITKVVGSNRIFEGKCSVEGEVVATGKMTFGKLNSESLSKSL